MKFTDGNWLMRPGVAAHYAAQAYSISKEGDSLKILAPTRVIRHRGDTLQGPVLTVRLSSPMADVIRVRVSHFEGVRENFPQFELFESPGPVECEIRGDQAWLQAGRLRATVPIGDTWGIDFSAEGKTVTRSPARAMALMEVEGEGRFLSEQLMLGVGECVYGLGERFTAFVKNGQTVDIWNRDGGTNSEQAYKNIPFYLTNRGYGVFVNDSGPVSFEVGSERTSRVQFSVPGESLEYFVIYGPTPKEVLEKYTALTGRPALPPAWTFGLWLSTSFTTNYDEKTVTEFIDGMAEREIPLSVFHYDCFWMRGFQWCDFEWDPEVFPDPKAMLARLHDRGLKVSVWINPYIAQASALFAEAAAHGYLLRKANGDVWQWDLWQPGMGIVDFTNPEAKAWFQTKLWALKEMGVDAFKTDFGERIPTDVVYHDGSDPVRMHNFYTLLYNQAVWEVLEAPPPFRAKEETREGLEREKIPDLHPPTPSSLSPSGRKQGGGGAVLFARSATAGSQQFPVHWGGDCWSDFEAMAESLRGGLSLGLSGFGFWSHDIGGFEGLPPASLYKRWVAFGLLSSHSRLHGSGSYRVPWVYDEEAVDVLRFFTRLKNRLMPYLWSQAVEAHERGLPMMRAMHLEFPDDPACDTLDRQYMLGESLLVAPVFSEDGVVEYYVPAGTWTQLLTGEEIEGPRWVRESHGYLSVPLLVRPGTLLPIGSIDHLPDYLYTAKTIFVPFQVNQVACCKVYDPDSGETSTVTVTNGKLTWTVGIDRAMLGEPTQAEIAHGGLAIRILEKW